MTMKMRLIPQLSQKLIMTPQLQQAIKLLQLSRLELQQSLAQHLEENPLLEEVLSETEEVDSLESEEKVKEVSLPVGQEPQDEGETREERGAPEEFTASGWEDDWSRDRGGMDQGYSSSTQEELPSYEQTVAKATSLEEHLLWQLSLSGLSEEKKLLGRLIIGNLEDDGYLRVPLSEIVAGTQFPEPEAESVLMDIQAFDPTGVAARDLSECLLLQLRHLGRNPIGSLGSRPGALKTEIIKSIVVQHLKDLERRQYAKIAKALGVTIEEVLQATKIIENLEPKPGRPFANTQNYTIIPDVFVIKNEGQWVVVLNDEGLPRMRIAPYYKQLMSMGRGDTPETKAYMDEKLRAAQWVIRSIEQRNKTIVKVVSSIVKFQEQFFDFGVQYLKPLVLKQVAEDIGMHESTISRVTANKYMHCEQGILELKYFFNAGLKSVDHPSDEVSSVSVREKIKEMVANENPQRPLKDDEIAAQLRLQQVIIARRTVAKYRAEENIPSASQRKRYH